MQLNYCSIEWTEYGCVTYFEDGSEASAWPAWDDPHYRVISHRLGYGDDLLSYCREHDFCHCVVEQSLHDRPSRVIWALAHGTVLSGPESSYEEFAAQALQRFLRANEWPIVSGVDWEAIKWKALELLDAENHRISSLASPVQYSEVAEVKEETIINLSSVRDVRRTRANRSSDSS